MKRTSYQRLIASHAASRGFSLIETLVAIGILVTAIVGPMTIAAKGLQSAYFAREQFAAVYLGQEGVEMVRRMRDNYALTNASTDTDNWYADAIPNECKTATGCGLDARDFDTVVDCSSASACRLNFDTSATIGSRGMYTYEAGGSLQESLYTRTIYVTGNNTEAEVRAVVTWRSGLFGGDEKSVVLRTRLFNQYDDY